MPTTHSSRILALDGLRGLALLCVLASHIGLPLFGGSVIMFTLSGFLITSLLLKEMDQTGRLSIPRFYARRAQRLLPALVVMLAVINLVVTLTRPQEIADLISDTIYTLAYLNNWSQMTRPSSLLAHLWSLSIQEQFYLVWPLVLVLLRRYRRGVLLAVCVALAVGSWALRVSMLRQGASIAEIYLPTATRVDSVFLGCALAAMVSMPLYGRVVRAIQTRPTLIHFLSLSSVLILLVCLTLYPLRSPLTYTVSIPMLSLSTAVLIALCRSARASGLTQVLAHPLLVHLGTISYGVYLWHFPLLILMSSHGAALVGGLIMGHVSYRLIEAPLLKRH